jgi:predicted nucleic acid-binding protein
MVKSGTPTLRRGCATSAGRTLAASDREVAVLLDTTVLIDVLRGRPETVARLRALRRAGDDVYVSAVNVEEVVRGLRPAEADAAARLFSGTRLAPLGEREGWRAGEWRREQAAGGVTLSQADGLVAAAAMAVGARLATGNPRDFPMTDLVVEHWPVDR